jgi:hypothetical protein
MKKKEISISVLGLSVVTLRKCRFDHPFPNHVTRWWVRTSPPHSVGLDRLFKPRFLGLTLRYRNAGAWTCDLHAWFSFTYIYINLIPPFCNYAPELGVSVFLYPWSFSLACCFCPFVLKQRAAFKLSLSLVNMS